MRLRLDQDLCSNVMLSCFRDNVGIAKVKESITPPGRITWGKYRVSYIATDSSGNAAQCTFSVFIKRKLKATKVIPITLLNILYQDQCHEIRFKLLAERLLGQLMGVLIVNPGRTEYIATRHVTPDTRLPKPLQPLYAETTVCGLRIIRFLIAWVCCYIGTIQQ